MPERTTASSVKHGLRVSFEKEKRYKKEALKDEACTEEKEVARRDTERGSPGRVRPTIGQALVVGTLESGLLEELSLLEELIDQFCDLLRRVLMAVVANAL